MKGGYTMGADTMQTLTSFGFLAVIFGVFYFFTIRPQMKQQKKLQAMRKNLQKGDRIVTIGGFYGKVIALKDDMITIEIKPDNIRAQIVKSAIAEVTSQSEKIEETNNKKDQ